MKQLNNYINEKLRISSKYYVEHKYFPTTRNELSNILEERLDEDKNADLNDIDVSQITDMFCLFKGLDPHDIDVSYWNVSNVKDMTGMFCECDNFVGKGLENWDVSKVECMQEMFKLCEKFNCDLSNWDIKNVKQTEDMFSKCYEFTGKGLENWDVSNVEDMGLMFFACIIFNCDLSDWDVSKVDDMDCMFFDCEKFNCDLNSWNINNNVYTSGMFDGTPLYNNPPKWYNA